MRETNRWIRGVAVAVLLLCAFCTAIHAATYNALVFQKTDTQAKLDTSRQRERKQTYEYEQVVASFPTVEAGIEAAEPLAAAANAKVTELKTRRKELRTEKEALAQQQADAAAGLSDAAAKLEALSLRLDAIAPAQEN